MTLEVAPTPTPVTPAVWLDEHGRTPRGLWRITTTFFRRQPVGAIGVVLVLIFGLAGIFADTLSPYSLTANDFAAMTEPPSWAHWLGTDQLGRDLLSRILYGARTAFIVGLTSSIIGGSLGLVIGVGSAYFGGQIDLWLQRVIDIVMAFSAIIMALAIVSIFGTGVANVLLAITLPRIRPHRALLGLGDPRGALCRRGARPRLRPHPDHPAPHGAERDGAVSRRDHRLCRPGDPRRSRSLLSRSRGAGAGAGLGPDAAGRSRGIRLDRAVDRGLPRPRDHAAGVRHQFVRRRLARRARPEIARPLSASGSQVPAKAGSRKESRLLYQVPLIRTDVPNCA